VALVWFVAFLSLNFALEVDMDVKSWKIVSFTDVFCFYQKPGGRKSFMLVLFF